MSAAVNSRHDVLHAHVVLCSDLLESFPESIFKADAGPMAGDHDRSFDDWRFQLPLHFSHTLLFNCSAASIRRVPKAPSRLFRGTAMRVSSTLKKMRSASLHVPRHDRRSRKTAEDSESACNERRVRTERSVVGGAPRRDDSRIARSSSRH
jgi:hypothetical protein